MRQLSVYATGSPVRFSDRAKIDQIVESTKPSGDGVRPIVEQRVQQSFLSK